MTERSVEVLTWASIVIWLGFTLLAHLLGYVWLVVMMLGIILLSSAIYQHSQGWHTSASIWVFGIWMAVFSVIEIVSEMVGVINGTDGLGIDLWVYLGIALISMGVAFVLRTMNAPRARGSYQAGGSRRDPYPRRVDDDYSTGYVSPQTSSGRRQGTRRMTAATRGSSEDAPDYGTAGGSGYESAPQQYGRQRSYRQDRGARSARPQAGTRRQTAVDPYADWPAPEEEQEAQPRRRTAAPSSRGQAAARQPRRAAPQAAVPSDLESRVEDIIRRSRERRSTPADTGDDLPY